MPDKPLQEAKGFKRILSKGCSDRVNDCWEYRAELRIFKCSGSHKSVANIPLCLYKVEIIGFQTVDFFFCRFASTQLISWAVQ